MRDRKQPDSHFPERNVLEALADLVEHEGHLLVITGAGCSTASGIPDYRGPDGRWKHSEPIRFPFLPRGGRARDSDCHRQPRADACG